MKKTLLFILFAGCFLLQVDAQAIHELGSNTYVKEYLISGPFHQEGFEVDDYAKLLEIEFIENEENFGTETDKIETVLAKAGRNNSVDFNKYLGDSAAALAYAQFEVSAPEKSKALFLIRASDGAKIYLNGKNVHTSFGGSIKFHATLQKGDNRVVIKVPNLAWNWDLSVRILGEEKAREYLDNLAEERDYMQFLHAKLQPGSGVNADPRFRPGSFPELDFDNPLLARKYLGGSYHISTRWFDGDLDEVQYPKKAGPYAYYAEIKGANGLTLKKSGIRFCSNDWGGGFQRLHADLDYIALNGIPESTWEAHQRTIGDYAGFALLSSAMMQDEGSVLLAFVDHVHKNKLEPGPLNSPLIIYGDYQAKLKQKILGLENKFPELKPPAVTQKTAPTLEKLPESQAGQYKDFISDLEKESNEWMEDGGYPFDIMIAKGGKIIYHGCFGEDDYGKYTTETPTEIASITKLLTGMLFAQFVDQGIIGIDDPVGKFLPDFPLSGPNAVTFRHCFTHTSGFNGHAMFGGVHNPWLENTLSLVIKDDTVGTKRQYNGMGYDLAGKVMEVVTGKSIFRLFREYLYDPLEMNNTVHDVDLGFSCNSTAMDLAKVAQLLLNKGTYGNLHFFSPETYEMIIPKDLNEFYPGINWKWGIGINIQGAKVLDEKTGKQRTLIADDILGHGSATSNVLWVDREHDMVITETRRRGFRRFGIHHGQVIQVVEDHLTD